EHRGHRRGQAGGSAGYGGEGRFCPRRARCARGRGAGRSDKAGRRPAPCAPGMRLLVATRNAGKLREVRARVRGLEVVSLDDVPPMPEVEETEETLEGNARLKALAAARGSGLWAVADDSGLFVDALGGAPGVRSARYAPGTDADRVQALLREMERVPD